MEAIEIKRNELISQLIINFNLNTLDELSTRCLNLGLIQYNEKLIDVFIKRLRKANKIKVNKMRKTLNTFKSI
jgi:dTDP-D-glucose 4,6-dehydratase